MILLAESAYGIAYKAKSERYEKYLQSSLKTVLEVIEYTAKNESYFIEMDNAYIKTDGVQEALIRLGYKVSKCHLGIKIDWSKK